MKFNYLLVTLIAFAITSCNGQASKNIKTINAISFSKEIQSTSDAQILDVRTPEEYAAGHLIKAQNVNWLSADFTSNTSKYDKSKPVFIYCKSGRRSHLAAEKLSELGFETIVEMEGGIIDWDAKGLSKRSE